MPPVDLGELPVAEPGVVRFLAIGDAGERTAHLDRVVAAMTAFCAVHGCDFGLLLGDNAYQYGIATPDDPLLDEVFTVPFADLNVPFYAVLGNHDYGDSTQEGSAAAQIAWAGGPGRFKLPAPAYTFTAGPARFVALDTNDVFWWGGADQGRWIDAIDDGGRVPVVFAHHPYKANAPHGNAGAYEGLTGVPWLSGLAVKRFYEDHVCGRFALALTGHDHVRQQIESCGTTWIVSGAAAKPSRVLDRGNTPVFSSAEAGFAWVHIGPEGVRTVFVDENGKVEFPR